MTTAAIVLTGGRSSRMGTDKATLVVDGRRLVDRVIDALRGSGVPRIVVAGPTLGGLGPGVECRADPSDDALGPMAGIVSAWDHLCAGAATRPDTVLVVACDLPDLASSVLDELAASSSRARHGAIASDGDALQPLLAAYRPAALDDLAEAFANGERSVRRCLGGWELSVVVFEPEAVVDADKPADLGAFTVEWPDDAGEEPPR